MSKTFWSTAFDSDDIITFGDKTFSLNDTVITGTTDSYSYADAVTVTVDDNYTFDPLSFGDLFSSSVSVGNKVLTEEKVEKLEALIDIMESDTDLAEMLKTQMAFNRIKNETNSD